MTATAYDLTLAVAGGILVLCALWWIGSKVTARSWVARRQKRPVLTETPAEHDRLLVELARYE